MIGTLAILNVAGGDVKISFNNTDPAETIRARRVVKDMLRRGFALLVEVERGGVKAFERALDFDEKTDSYVIADHDPTVAEVEDALGEAAKERRAEEKAYGESSANQTRAANDTSTTGPKSKPVNGRRRGRIAASKTRAVGVARSAGG